MARIGRNAGSVVNLVTKAGTNRFSGSAWEFNRDDALQARNFFAQPGLNNRLDVAHLSPPPGDARI